MGKDATNCEHSTDPSSPLSTRTGRERQLLARRQHQQPTSSPSLTRCPMAMQMNSNRTIYVVPHAKAIWCDAGALCKFWTSGVLVRGHNPDIQITCLQHRITLHRYFHLPRVNISKATSSLHPHTQSVLTFPGKFEVSELASLLVSARDQEKLERCWKVKQS